MKYIVWQKQEYQELYTRFDCDDDIELNKAITTLLRASEDVVVTVPVKFSVNVVVGKVDAEYSEAAGIKAIKLPEEKIEEVKVESSPVETPRDRSANSKSHGKV